MYSGTSLLHDINDSGNMQIKGLELMKGSCLPD